MALAVDESGTPFMAIKDQEQKAGLGGLDAQKAKISSGKAVARLHSSLKLNSILCFWIVLMNMLWVFGFWPISKF